MLDFLLAKHNPSVKRSGQFIGTKNAMSKRGSPMLRKALYLAALKSICQEKTVQKSTLYYLTIITESARGNLKK